MLHLRPTGGYQGLLVLGPGQRQVEVPDVDASFLSSATAWRHIQAHGVPVAIDVLTGTLVIDPGGPAPSTLDAKDAGFDGKRTLAVARRRQTTHMLVLPLNDVGGALVGQISLEAHCVRAVGKPFIWPDCVDDLRALVDMAAPYLLCLPAHRQEAPTTDSMLPVVGQTMEPIVRNLRVFARNDETILLLGATGTGKSRLARWCHARSPRADGPFEVVDLNAVPGDLQQGELFGWRKGAFTGAGRDQDGAVYRARGGTLFIDEIDKLDLRAQASMLRLLEEGTYRPLGGDRDESAELRFVVGTNADLDHAIAQGRFLPDLYYRINVLPIRLPTLAERRDELPDWARFMVERRAGPERAVVLEPPALEPLLEQRWPGNLRQLDNVLRRAFALALVDVPPAAADHGPLTIGHDHVEAALMMEHARSRTSAEPGGTLAPIQRAAAWVADHAARLHRGGRELPLETAVTAFRGLVLLAAIERGELETAFESLGRGKLVKSRNHQKSLRTAKEQIEALRSLLGDE
ncbi:MAG: sigma-54-dependent Fis family transcriptional regulator [Myxococcales bacterium]|nr:sigma-54-dependent Fis family transcriptional regulator [Myxococcales bacterium]